MNARSRAASKVLRRPRHLPTSSVEAAGFGVPVANLLPLGVDVFDFDSVSGATTYIASVKAGSTLAVTTVNPGVRITLSATGAIVTDQKLPLTTAKLIVEPAILRGPNHIPAPPQPSDKMPIPPDTVPHLVGIGFFAPDAKSRVTFLREQYWRKGSESFSLPPRSTIQKILRETSGRTATSSTAEEATNELGMSIEAGWGPFSASASASLSTTSQRTDTLTIREESSSTVIQSFTNESDRAIVVCLWQLMERIRVFKGEKSAAAVDSGTVPLIPLSYSPSPGD